MDMFRVTARWNGFPGAPGWSNFYFASGFFDGGLFGDEAELLVERVRSAFSQLTGTLATGTSVQVLGEVPIIDSDSGMIQEYVTVDQPEPVVSGSSDGFVGPAGAVVTWRTNDLRNGRRIRGRTFLVPIAGHNFEDDGTLDANALGEIDDFANALRGGAGDGDLGVWSRPSGGSGGVFASVVSHTIPDMAAVLRSRRD